MCLESHSIANSQLYRLKQRGTTHFWVPFIILFITVFLSLMLLLRQFMRAGRIEIYIDNFYNNVRLFYHFLSSINAEYSSKSIWVPRTHTRKVDDKIGIKKASKDP